MAEINENMASVICKYRALPSEAQARYLARRIKGAGGKLPLFDTDG